MDFKNNFKPLKLIFVLILATVSLMGCGRFLQKNNSNSSQDGNVLRVQAKEFSCLKPWPQNVKNYFNDQSSEEETGNIFSCLSGALQTFGNLTQGADPNHYTANELMLFFNRYLLKENQISTALMMQLMKIKVLLVGGTEANLTRDEIPSILQFITIFCKHGLILRGHWKVLLLSQVSVLVTTEELQDLQTKIGLAFTDLIGQSSATSSNYQWQDFQDLVDLSENFFQDKSTFYKLKYWMPLITSLQKLFVGDSSAATAAGVKPVDGWLDTFHWLNEVYALFAQFYYQVLPGDFQKPQTWWNVIAFVDKALDALKTSPQMSSRAKLLSSADLDKVIDQLHAVNILNGDLTPEVIKEAYHRVFSILKKTHATAGNEPINENQGFDSDILKALQFEYLVWRTAEVRNLQGFSAISEKINLINKGEPQDPLYQDFVLEMYKIPPQQDFPQDLTSFEASRLEQSWTDWLGLLSIKNPLVFVQGAHLLLPFSASTTKINVFSLSLVNSLRSFVRLVEMGYGSYPATAGVTPLWSGQFTKQSIHDWADNFQNLGQALHFLDPKEPDAGGSAYMNARYFTPSSVGEINISSQQLLDLLSLMISGGKVLADQLMVKLQAEGCFDLTVDPDPSFQKPLSQKDCFERVFRKNFDDLYSSLPSLVNEVKIGHLTMDDVLFQAEAISEKKSKLPKFKGYIEYPEIRVMSGVLFYMESLMEVFDTNKDELLSKDEVLAALPRFADTMHTMNPYPNWISDEECFLYIAYRGKKNPTYSEFRTFYYELHPWFGKAFDEKVSRKNILQVIAVIKQDSDEKAPKKSASFY